MKNMSATSREKFISLASQSKPPPKIDFLQQVQLLYQIFTRQKHHPGFPPKLLPPQQKKQKQTVRRTRSKSGRQKKTPPSSPVRKSKRIRNSQIQEDKYLQIDQQPLWNPQKLQKKTNSKVGMTPKLIVTDRPKIGEKAKPNESLSEFHSVQEEESLLSKKRKQDEYIRQQSQLSEIERIEHKQSRKGKNDLTMSQVRRKQEQQNDENCDPQLAIAQNEVQEWKPDKSFAQLIKIQQIIDNYFLFNLKYRSNRIIEVQKLIDYVRDIQGYYFDRSRLDKLIWLNHNLYKLLKIEQEWFIKCPVFNEHQIEKRLKNTKIAMIKFCRRQAA